MKVAEVIHHDAAKISKLIKKPLLNELWRIQVLIRTILRQLNVTLRATVVCIALSITAATPALPAMVSQRGAVWIKRMIAAPSGLHARWRQCRNVRQCAACVHHNRASTRLDIRRCLIITGLGLCETLTRRLPQIGLSETSHRGVFDTSVHLAWRAEVMHHVPMIMWWKSGR